MDDDAHTNGTLRRVTSETTADPIVVFALMGIVLVLHGLGVLIGVDGLSAVGATLADIFGWSSL